MIPACSMMNSISDARTWNVDNTIEYKKDIKRFPERPLAPATEKYYGEAGVLLPTGSGEPTNFHKACESCRCYGGGLWQKCLPSKSYDNPIRHETLSLTHFPAF
jgi:hypothetical protein